MSEQVQEATTLGEVERLVEAARDSMTDEMVSRLASTVSDGVELMDQVNRAKLGRAIPALAELVNNGDLDRLVQLARIYGSMQDAMTEEMVGRLSETIGAGLTLLDRFNRGGADRLLQILERLEASGALERAARVMPQLADRLEMLERMLHCFEAATHESDKQAPERGGVFALWSMMKDPETQRSLRFFLILARKMRETCVER